MNAEDGGKGGYCPVCGRPQTGSNRENTQAKCWNCDPLPWPKGVPQTEYDVTGWRINRINRGTPFHVAEVGPDKLLQVQDESGTVALSGPRGAVFVTPRAAAEELCSLANAGFLPQD